MYVYERVFFTDPSTDLTDSTASTVRWYSRVILNHRIFDDVGRAPCPQTTGGAKVTVVNLKAFTAQDALLALSTDHIVQVMDRGGLNCFQFTRSNMFAHDLI